MLGRVYPSNIGMVAANAPSPSIPQPGTVDTVGAQHARASWGALALLLVFGGLYIGYSFLSRHQKIGQAVKPANIAANLHNLAVIFVGVVFSIGLFKIGAVKWQAAKLPGGKTVAKLAGLV